MIVDTFEEWAKSSTQKTCIKKWADKLLDLGASWGSFRGRDKEYIASDMIAGGIPLLAAREVANTVVDAIKQSQAPMAIFWDLEKMPPPTTKSYLEVARRLKLILSPYGEVVQFRGYSRNGASMISQDEKCDLWLAGCRLVDCPTLSNKDVADKMIIVDAMQFAYMYPQGVTLCFITGDVDYS